MWHDGTTVFNISESTRYHLSFVQEIQNFVTYSGSPHSAFMKLKV